MIICIQNKVLVYIIYVCTVYIYYGYTIHTHACVYIYIYIYICVYMLHLKLNIFIYEYKYIHVKFVNIIKYMLHVCVFNYTQYKHIYYVNKNFIFDAINR